MRHHAPLSSTGVLHLSACASRLFRHHVDSTAVLDQNGVALGRFQRLFGPKTDARPRHVAHSPPVEHVVPGAIFSEFPEHGPRAPARAPTPASCHRSIHG
jgi:hypothetical protein